MRERDHIRRGAETDQHREDRLQQMRERDHTRRGAETDQQREDRLQLLRDQQQRRLDAETDQQRGDRLQQMRDQQQQRLDVETHQHREDRLQQIREQQHDRRAVESPELTRRRLQLVRETRQRQSVTSHVALLDQPAVRAKMRNFHLSITNIDVPKCITCLESFPGMSMCTDSNECNRCHRDQCSPKLFSHANNVDPGDVPLQ